MYTDTTVATRTTYWYSVSAFNATGYSARSAATTASVTTRGQLPSTPVLTFTAATTTSLSIAWTEAVPPAVTGFDVQRSNNSNSGWATIAANLPPTPLTYVNTGLPRRTARFYRVRVNNADGSSGWSNVVTGVTQ